MRLLIKNGIIVTMDSSRRIVRDGAVAVEGDVITAVDKASKLVGFPADKVIDANSNIVMPGFVDTHHHHWESIPRGVADDAPLHILTERLYPLGPAVSEEDVYLSAMLSCIEHIRHGTICSLDPGGPHMDSVAQAVADSGMRGVISYFGADLFAGDIKESRNVPSNWPGKLSTDQVVAEEERLFKRWHGAEQGRIRFCYGLHREFQVSPRLFREVKRLADRDGTIVQMHTAVTPERVRWFTDKYGLSPVEYLESIKVLDSRWLFIHLVVISDKEVDLCGARGVRVSHALGASVHGTYGAISRGKFPELLGKGVIVSLSSDSAVADNTFDMFRLMYLASTLHKEVRLVPDLIPPEKALEMATIDGARALMWDDQIGSIETGKKADMIIVDTHRPNWRPLHDFNIVGNLVYSGAGDDVLTTIVGGNVLYEDRRFTHINVAQVLEKAQQASERLFSRMPYKLQPRWPVT
ncbi:MAG: amidohydrolase [Chloroflexi bacterium]|nr:amidohydrolase [Chloroflexota bacterium]